MFILNYFRCHIEWGAKYFFRPVLHLLRGVKACESEISDLHSQVILIYALHQYVLSLNISKVVLNIQIYLTCV